MKKLILLLASVSLYAQTPAVSFGTGPTITWYSNSGLTTLWAIPNGGIQHSQTIWGQLSAPGTASCYGTCSTGTLTTINSTTIRFDSNSTINACHTNDGLQLYPCDDIFFARVDSLPKVSSHYNFDGSNSCGEAAGTGAGYVPCEGDPLAGTGQYEYVEPEATAPNASVCPSGPLVSGATYTNSYLVQCHIMQIIGAPMVTAPVSNGTVLRGTELLTRPVNNVYLGSPTMYPESRPFTPSGTPNNMYYENRQGGTMRIPGLTCAVASPNWPQPVYSNCSTGGAAPFAVNLGEDEHEAFVDPVNFDFFENYNSTDRSGPGALQVCTDKTHLNCTTGSFRNIGWTNYDAVIGIGLASTPEYPLELTGQEILKLAIDGPTTSPIQHQLVRTLGGGAVGWCSFAINAGAWVWPSQGPGGSTCAAPTVNQATRQVIGARVRLAKDRTSMSLPVVKSFTVTNAGANYVAGTRVPFTITGCTDIVPGIHPSGVIYIGQTGSIAFGNSHSLVFVSNTGKNCGAVAAVVPASPSGVPADNITLTVNLQNSWINSNVAQGLYDQETNYGVQLDDIGGTTATPNIRSDSYLQHSAYYPAVDEFFSSSLAFQGVLFGSGLLYDQVDQSSAIPQASGFPTSSWISSTANMAGAWIADATVASLHLPNQSIIKTVATTGGAIAYTPIPALGTGVGCAIGDLSDQINIVSGMTAYQLPCYVTGDPSNAGWTASIVVDPCSGSDTLTSGGLYTTCPQFDQLTAKQGVFKITSVANTNAYSYLTVFVVPVDTNGIIRVDSGSAIGQAVTYPSGNPFGPTGGGTVNFFGDITSQATTGNYVQGIMHSLSKPRTTTTDVNWIYYGMQGSNPHAPERLVFQSASFDFDVSYTFIVPNGNYVVRDMYGENYGTSINLSHVPYGNRPFQTVQTNESVQHWNTSQLLQGGCSGLFACPQDVFTPIRVSNNELFYSKRGTNLNRWSGQSPFGSSSGPAFNAQINGMVITPDTTTPAHWDMGSFKRNEYERGDQFQVGIGDGVNSGANALGAPYSGALQLYVRPVYTTTAIDPVWSVLNGIGTVDAVTGMYQAPSNAPPNNECAVVQAKSSSVPTLFVNHAVCFGNPPSTALTSFK